MFVYYHRKTDWLEWPCRVTAQTSSSLSRNQTIMVLQSSQRMACRRGDCTEWFIKPASCSVQPSRKILGITTSNQTAENQQEDIKSMLSALALPSHSNTCSSHKVALIQVHKIKACTSPHPDIWPLNCGLKIWIIVLPPQVCIYTSVISMWWTQPDERNTWMEKFLHYTHYTLTLTLLLLPCWGHCSPY